MFQEQRKAARKVLRTKAIVAMDGYNPLLGKTADVGSTGVSICVPHPITAGLVGQLNFDLLTDGTFVPMQTRAKVSYCIFSGGDYKVGFHFINLEPGASSALARFMR